MNKNIIIIILSIFLTLPSCGVNMGDRIDTGNLSVYFLKGIEKEKAISFAKYWRDKGFVGERKQVIQLERDESIILIKLIEREKYYDEGINITEEAMLQQIERDLYKNVFQEEVEIVITDNTFRPLLKRNNL